MTSSASSDYNFIFKTFKVFFEMPNPGPIDQNRDLLADLKQDEQNAKANNESQATQEHIAGMLCSQLKGL